MEKWKVKQKEEAEALNQQTRLARTKLWEELSRQQNGTPENRRNP